MFQRASEKTEEIVRIAFKLGFIMPEPKTNEPMIKVSDMKLCLACMADDGKLTKLRNQYNARIEKEQKR